jgi:hypothetical protein
VAALTMPRCPTVSVDFLSISGIHPVLGFHRADIAQPVKSRFLFALQDKLTVSSLDICLAMLELS